MPPFPDTPFAIDADGHVHEDEALFRDYLEPEFRNRTRGHALDENRNRRFYVDGVPHPPFPDSISIRKPMAASNRIRVLDKERIAAAVLFPSATLIASYLDPPFAQAMSRAYNRWISDYVGPHRGRLHFAAAVSLHDVGTAVAEARHAVDELGAVAVAVRPNPALCRTLDADQYDPFYAAVQELGVPLIIHESTGCPETLGAGRYGDMMDPGNYVYHHVVSHAFEQMFAAMSLLCGGVLERFPTLRVAFMEAGCSWLPYWLARLDDHFEHPKLGPQMAALAMRPSEYFQRQCMVTCDPGDHTLPLAAQGIGADRILFATDYPHFDSGGGSVAAFLDIPGLDDAQRRRILRDNAAAFFGIAVAATA